MMKIIIAFLILAGAAFMLIAAIGLLRFKDLYSRMHATTKATSFGILLLIGGVSLLFCSGIVFLKALLIIVFIYLTAPLAAHAIASSFKNDDEDLSD
jgi:multicomponent Na+:H+ antiporter subunit G